MSTDLTPYADQIASTQEWLDRQAEGLDLIRDPLTHLTDHGTAGIDGLSTRDRQRLMQQLGMDDEAIKAYAELSDEDRQKRADATLRTPEAYFYIDEDGTRVVITHGQEPRVERE